MSIDNAKNKKQVLIIKERKNTMIFCIEKLNDPKTWYRSKENIKTLLLAILYLQALLDFFKKCKGTFFGSRNLHEFFYIQVNP